ncbi:MAG: DNA polymerase III subunit [Anaerolineae bacterium]|nr:DNA polymerase III subunit [Anaerolineae bacterium]
MNWNITGHEWAATLLQQHIGSQQVRHAYLFSGPPGVGRRTLALRFVQALNCLKPPTPGEPCGECRVCKQTERMQHADLSVIQAETEGGIIKIDQVRDLQRLLSLAPFEARYRVALLLRFHEANDNAQNALLKTLEEAPSRAILLVTADSPEALLPTIVSRCEVLRLRPIGVPALSDLLLSRGASPEQAQTLAHVAGGRVGSALKMIQEPVLYENHCNWVEDMFGLLSASRRKRFAYAEQFKGGGREELRQALTVWLSVWRDVMQLAAGSQALLINLPRADQLAALAGGIGLNESRLMLEKTGQALEKLDNTNVNAQMLVEVLLLDWPYVR